MASIWLITGLLQYESGKTWYTIALARVLSKKGYRVTPYKPVAGHSAWYQFETVENSIRYKLLVGEDVVKYKQHLGVEYSLNILNPVDILSAPPSPRKYRIIAEYLAALEVLSEQMVMVRISSPLEERNDYYIVEGSEEKIVEGLRPWIEKLKEEFNPKPISIEDLVDELYSPRINNLLLEVTRFLSETNDILLVESFNDAATPFYGLLDLVERVFMVSPGYLYELDVRGFKRIAKKNYLLYGDTGTRMNKISNKVDRVFEAPLPIAESPLGLAEKLEKIIEGLI